jgi:hypothetical protein
MSLYFTTEGRSDVAISAVGVANLREVVSNPGGDPARSVDGNLIEHLEEQGIDAVRSGSRRWCWGISAQDRERCW